MRYLKYLVLLSALMVLPAAYSQAQVSVGVQVGPVYGSYNAPPVCEYGFYPDYPYGCAPYGYYGPDYFVNGVFIGVGPWANFYYSHAAFYRPYYFNRGFGVREGFRGFNGVDRFHEGGFRTFGSERAYRDDYRGYRGGDSYRGNGYRGGDSYRGNGYRGGDSYRGGGSYGNGRNYNNTSYHGGDRDHGGGSYNSGSHGGPSYNGGGSHYGGGGSSYNGGGSHNGGSYNGGGKSYGGGGSSYGKGGGSSHNGGGSNNSGGSHNGNGGGSHSSGGSHNSGGSYGGRR